MPDPVIDNRQFITSILKGTELGNISPFEAVFSTGQSGLSFGATQLDVANNKNAENLFERLLNAAYLEGNISKDQFRSFSEFWGQYT